VTGVYVIETERLLLRRWPMTRPDNARSRAVMARCGLTQRGEIEYHGWLQVHYAIDRSGWPRSGAALPWMEIRRVNAAG